MVLEIRVCEGPRAGTVYRYRRGRLDCADGPAVSSEDGTMLFLRGGALSRDRGLPPVVLGTGDVVFVEGGALRSGDSPAACLSDGRCAFLADGAPAGGRESLEVLALLPAVLRAGDAAVGFWTDAIFRDLGIAAAAEAAASALAASAPAAK